MNIKKIIIALAMLLVGVQGYAQSRRHHHPAPIYWVNAVTLDPYSPRIHFTWYQPNGCYYNSDYDISLYGSTSQPTKIRIKDVQFKRKSYKLKIKNGKEKSISLNTYKYNKIGYGNGDLHIVVETGNGDAIITVLDNNKEVIAIYTL